PVSTRSNNAAKVATPFFSCKNAATAIMMTPQTIVAIREYMDEKFGWTPLSVLLKNKY
ncbi:MAG: hypothetical protein JST36_03760, partial [Bacteroidetes bacterium]|nr:hypothetical protein [Bacteroidota bacterium]